MVKNYKKQQTKKILLENNSKKLANIKKMLHVCGYEYIIL